MSLKSNLRLWSGLRTTKSVRIDLSGGDRLKVYLVPPRKNKRTAPRLLVIKGNDFISYFSDFKPILSAYISEFIEQIQFYEYHVVTEEDLKSIENIILSEINGLCKFGNRKKMNSEDLEKALSIISKVSRGKLYSDKYYELDNSFDKYHGNRHDVLSSFSKYMSAPLQMNILVGNPNSDQNKNCGKRCFCCPIGCTVQTQNPSRKLEITEWAKVFEDLRKEGVIHLVFSGGEPTDEQDINQYEYQRNLVYMLYNSRRFITTYITNGLTLSKFHCDELSDTGLDEVKVILNGSSKLDLKLQGIQNAVEMGLYVSVAIPITENANYNYPELLNTLKDLGVKKISYYGYTGKVHTCSKKQLDNMIYQIITYSSNFGKENGIKIEFASPGIISSEKLKKLGLDLPRCGACLENMAVLPNGDIIPCQNWNDEEYVLGNVLNCKWKKVWNGHCCDNIRENSVLMGLSCPLVKKS